MKKLIIILLVFIGILLSASEVSFPELKKIDFKSVESDTKDVLFAPVPIKVGEISTRDGFIFSRMEVEKIVYMSIMYPRVVGWLLTMQTVQNKMTSLVSEKDFVIASYASIFTMNVEITKLTETKFSLYETELKWASMWKGIATIVLPFAVLEFFAIIGLCFLTYSAFQLR